MVRKNTKSAVVQDLEVTAKGELQTTDENLELTDAVVEKEEIESGDDSGSNEKSRKKRSAYSIHINNIKFIEGFNRRSSRTKFDELKAQILSAGGVLQPISGYWKNDTFWVFSGHGRTEAMKELYEAGCCLKATETPCPGKKVTPYVPALIDGEPKSDNDWAELLRRQILDNSGENFNPIDISRIVYELFHTYKKTKIQIANDLGFKVPNIHHYLAIYDLPDKVKKLVVEEKIAASLAVKVVKDKGVTDPISLITTAYNIAVSEGGEKATTRYIALAKEINQSTDDEAPEASNNKGVVELPENFGELVNEESITEVTNADISTPKIDMGSVDSLVERLQEYNPDEPSTPTTEPEPEKLESYKELLTELFALGTIVQGGKKGYKLISVPSHLIEKIENRLNSGGK